MLKKSLLAATAAIAIATGASAIQSTPAEAGYYSHHYYGHSCHYKYRWVKIRYYDHHGHYKFRWIKKRYRHCY